MAVFETPSSRKRRISSSLPSSRETPSEPFGRPSLRPEALALARPSRVRSENQVALDLGEQREQGGHDLGLDVALALDADVLLQGHEGDARLGEGVEHGDDLTQRPAEPGEFADDQTVAGLQGVRQLVQPATLLGSLSGGGRLDEVVDVEVVLPRVLQDGEALAARVLLRGRDAQAQGATPSRRPDRSPLPPARRGAARSRRQRRRAAGPAAVNRARGAACARTSPTWRTGRGATARPASSRRPSGTPG